MIDREKVIKGLECCIKYPNEYGDCTSNNCPYGLHVECHKELIQDALALLKAQEPVEPIQDMVGDALFWVCGKCGHDIRSADWYCANCGKKVKWE